MEVEKNNSMTFKVPYLHLKVCTTISNQMIGCVMPKSGLTVEFLKVINIGGFLVTALFNIVC